MNLIWSLYFKFFDEPNHTEVENTGLNYYAVPSYAAPMSSIVQQSKN